MSKHLLICLVAVGCTASGGKTSSPQGGKASVDDSRVTTEVPKQHGSVESESMAPTSGISLLIADDAFWLATSDGALRAIGLCANEHDTERLTDALCELREAEAYADASSLEIAGMGAATYQMLVSGLDASIAAGFNAEFVAHSALKVKAEPHDQGVASLATCGQPSKGCSGKTPVDIGGPLPPKSGGLRKAPIIIVTTTEFTMGDTTFALEDLVHDSSAAAESLRGTFARQRAHWEQEYKADTTLTAKERDILESLVILQADRSSNVALLAKIIGIANKAGYTDVMFAVNVKKNSESLEDLMDSLPDTPSDPANDPLRGL